MNIAVIGTGYVGLVAGTCFAETGNKVICVDNVKEKIDTLNNGGVPIYEPGLETLIKRNMEEERLSFSTDLDDAVKRSYIIFIAVGTPTDKDGSSDLSAVLAVARSIGTAMNDYKIIVDKSTVPVGTAEKVSRIIAAETDHEFDVVSNPEFLKEGAAIDDFMKPDRVVIGTSTPKVAEIMKDLYSPFVRTGNPVLAMDVASAELSKYASNAMLATRISFMNEIANLCERLGGNINDIRRAVGLDSRIGTSFLFAGCGYGGSCFPKDIKALLKTGTDVGFGLQILQSVEDVKAAQKRVLVDKILAYYGPNLDGMNFAVWGLAFKPRTDDMREAPSITVINALLDAGAGIRAFDPEAMSEAKRIFGDRIQYCKRDHDALEGADGLILVTEWNEFRHPDFELMKQLLKRPVIFDGRNIYKRKKLEEKGFTYFGIGRS